MCHRSRDGQPALHQSASSAARQSVLRPRRTGSGVFPAECKAHHVRADTPHNLAAALAPNSSGAGLVVAVSVMACPLGVLPFLSAVVILGSLFPPRLFSRALQRPLSVGQFLRGGDYPLHRSHDPKMYSLSHARSLQDGHSGKVRGKCARTKGADLQEVSRTLLWGSAVAESAWKMINRTIGAVRALASTARRLVYCTSGNGLSRWHFPRIHGHRPGNTKTRGPCYSTNPHRRPPRLVRSDAHACIAGSPQYAPCNPCLFSACTRISPSDLHSLLSVDRLRQLSISFRARDKGRYSGASSTQGCSLVAFGSSSAGIAFSKARSHISTSNSRTPSKSSPVVDEGFAVKIACWRSVMKLCSQLNAAWTFITALTGF